MIILMAIRAKLVLDFDGIGLFVAGFTFHRNMFSFERIIGSRMIKTL
jgi:hypothetical protein